ncbi:MAG: YfcE family phosphodiesterase [Pseudomonadales bacterium]
MKIGVVSDTHNNLRNVGRIVELFNAAGVDRVIHTGDITQAKTLDVFAGLEMPMWGVYGNNDQERESLMAAIEGHGFSFYEPPLELVWHERRIVVVHDPLEFHGALHSHHHIALHGHTHLHRYETRDGQLWFNPGECAGHMSGYNAVGMLDLETLSAELLKF